MMAKKYNLHELQQPIRGRSQKYFPPPLLGYVRLDTYHIILFQDFSCVKVMPIDGVADKWSVVDIPTWEARAPITTKFTNILLPARIYIVCFSLTLNT